MDDRRSKFSLCELCEPVGSEVAPIAENVQREGSLAAYRGTDRQVSEGFRIAWRLMGLDANFPPVGIALAHQQPNTEDN